MSKFDVGEVYYRDNVYYLAFDKDKLLGCKYGSFFEKRNVEVKQYENVEDLACKALAMIWEVDLDTISEKMARLLRYDTLVPAKNTISTTLTLNDQQRLGYEIRKHKHINPWFKNHSE